MTQIRHALKIQTLAAAMTVAISTVASATPAAPFETASGLYAGSYVCKDGEHGVLLNLELTKRQSGRGLELAGSLAFFPVLGGAEGSFANVTGQFKIQGLLADNGRVVFKHTEWIRQPDGYGAANFNGNISKRDDGIWQIIGKPVAGANSDDCSNMVVTHLPGG